ncbi:hypothetical protein MKW92_042780 [Papaver armeniacum]|nr:hypothetical protein MKW92_042780 [Papaver armeniacum]
MSNNPSSSSSSSPNKFDDQTTTTSSTTTDQNDSEKKDITKSKLRKIPPIPIRRPNKDETLNSILEDGRGGEYESSFGGDSSPIVASALGLNHIRTRSDASPLPSRFSTTPSSAPPVIASSSDHNNVRDAVDVNKPKWTLPRDPVKKSLLNTQSKSLRLPFILNPALQALDTAKEIQSPRFQAILRVTSGRRKRNPADVKSFSHELNSKGVRPFPFWKSRALAHPEEIMAIIRTKFDRLKEEVNSDLGILAGDLVSILEKNADAHPEWRETLEDLLVVARKCAMMSPSEFWTKCETIVQNLDDKRQELPMGILKQAHTRILFILTRCTRLLQFQNENMFEDEHILGLHQLSDLGVYPAQMYEGGFQVPTKSSLVGKEANEKHPKKPQDHDDQKWGSSEPVEPGTAKSVDSCRDRMSSWKKLPCAAEKNQRKDDEISTPCKDKTDSDKTALGISDSSENVNTPECLPDASDVPPNVKRVTWGLWGDQHSVAYENSMICRICEVEIPTVHVEFHSRICTIADRCDLKGLTVNERLERVAETLEKILETCTPKGSDTAEGSPEVARVSTSSVSEEIDGLSPRANCSSHACSKNLAEYVPEDQNALFMDELKVSTGISCKTLSAVIPDPGIAASSAGSMTPRSPLMTPRTSQLDLLLGGRWLISECENFQQINKLLDIARSVASVNSTDYSTLAYLVDRLEDLKYAIQDRKVDALVVETFGRRIEKLLQEKYVHLCAQIDDEKVDSSSFTVDEDSSDSVRGTPMNTNGKDRTSIEDFEIIKPISRGAFGRVFLARKRATGDLFAIKVLKKADMIRKNAVESILAERNILISVRNPFVVRFFYSFTCRDNLYLVMEYLNGGDLYSLLRNLGCLEEEMARIYIAELVLALEYLHSMNVIHRDIKPDNLLIARDGHIKLTDFGLSKVGLINSTDDLSGPANTSLGDNEPKHSEQQTAKREQRQKQSAVGTPDYLAPEILLGMGHGTTADWWSVGVILFELLVGVPPFNAETPQQIFDNIMNRDIPWPYVPEEMSHEAFDLIDQLLIENPVQRLGATGAREVKRHPFFKDINWDTLARQKAAFIPAADSAYDTSYFTSRYIWSNADEHLSVAASDFDDMTETCSASCSSSSYSNQQDEDGDECGNLADFGGPNLQVKYSFSNFSFKNLSQLASINYDLVVKNNQDSPKAPNTTH